MKKLKSKSGMTLMEMMASLLILTLLVTAMGTGMDTAMNVYGDAMFESNSASLAGIVNTALSDVLRYAQDIRTKDTANGETFQDAAGNALGSNVGFVFTNIEYGVQDVYFQTKTGSDETRGILTLRSLRFDDQSGSIMETALVNAGAYPDLEITNFKAMYVEPGAACDIQLTDGTPVHTSRGGYFYITYTIQNTMDTTKTRNVETIVRLLNA